jgi:hypothetical protein
MDDGSSSLELELLLFAFCKETNKQTNNTHGWLSFGL